MESVHPANALRRTVAFYRATGTLKDYSPPSLAETRYYRRLALPAAGVVSLPVSNLITGIYLVQVIAQDGTSQPARLVKD